MEEFLRSIPAAGSIPYAFIAFAIAGLLFPYGYAAFCYVKCAMVLTN